MKASGRNVAAIGIYVASAFLPTAANLAAQQNNDAYSQALSNYKLGHYDAARLAIDDAEKAAPGNPDTEILKCRILTELGQFDEAAKALETLNNNPQLSPADGDKRTLAYADLCLRKRDFASAQKFYESLLARQPDNPDLKLKLIYAEINAGDLISAGKYASQLKPLDQDNPSYYFAHAALAEATGKSGDADQDIETVRTIYGITVTNRYLKTYLQVSSPHAKTGIAPGAPAPATNAAPQRGQP